MPTEQLEEPKDTEPRLLGIPFNRIVAFLGPYIALTSGAVADWLLVHVHLLGLFHFQHDGLATGIAQLIIFTLAAGITWLGHQTWLKGHHIELDRLTVGAAREAELLLAKYMESGGPAHQATGSVVAADGPLGGGD